MKIAIPKILRFFAFLSIGVLLLYFAFRGIDFSEMVHHFKEAKYSWIGLSLFFGILSHISRSRRWILLIEPINNRKPGLWITINAVLFGYFANFAFPRVGEITRCVALGKKENIPVNSLIGTVIVERTIDLLSMLIILLILLIARFEKFGAFFNDYVFQPISDKLDMAMNAGVFILITLILFALIVALVLIFRKRLLETKLFQKIASIVKGVISGLKTVVRMKNRWEFILHTLLIWLCYALMTWVVVFALPDITGDLKFVDGIFLLVIGSMGMAVPVQSGIGAFHWIVSRGLHFVYGLKISEGLVFATLQHESQTLLILILGSISMLILFSGKKNKPTEN